MTKSAQITVEISVLIIKAYPTGRAADQDPSRRNLPVKYNRIYGRPARPIFQG